MDQTLRILGACRTAGWVMAVATALGGCAHGPWAPTTPASSPSSTASSPGAPASPKAPSRGGAGDDALVQGVKAYQAGQYAVAEAQLKTALQVGVSMPAQAAKAHKHLAFIYCTSRRTALCEGAFKAAKAADPSFALTKAEAGHPMWGPVYRRAMGEPKAAR